ncbi:MAG: aminopeptidase [Gammaproteobacteria bacterium]|nr:aminopeptidase [Gammaproteobacteria bacterium]
MISMFDRKLLRAVVVTGFLTSISGCYYMQAASGQFEVMHKRVPITEIVKASDTPTELAARLRLVDSARQFAIDELGLPDNDSYRSYADIERDYVVWNVFAAAEFSLTPKRWCCPIAGCVSYRGYFSEDAARKKAARLQGKGYDVAVGGVVAYSTLGRFSDPVLNTMMRWQDSDLIAVMFHELAHQVLYVKDDSEFNESFATAVEEFAIERWLKSRDQVNELVAYRENRDFRQRLMLYVESARADLQAIYSSAIDVRQMRLQKQQRLSRLSDELNTEINLSGRESPPWLDENLNNARLASMNLYHGRLAEFRGLMVDCNNDIRCFYAAAKDLAESSLQRDSRD